MYLQLVRNLPVFGFRKNVRLDDGLPHFAFLCIAAFAFLSCGVTTCKGSGAKLWFGKSSLK